MQDRPEPVTLGVRDAFLMQIAVNPASLPGKIQLIVGRFETLSDKGSLGPRNFDSLVKYLEDALAALNQGNKPVAKQQLGAFIVEIQKLGESGWIAVH